MADNETDCPICREAYDHNASQARPIWSDSHDDIVCVTCAEKERG